MREVFLIQRGNTGEQVSGVFVLRFSVDHLSRSSFHNLSATQDHHFIANMLDDGKIVRNEQIGDPQLILQIFEQVNNLRLNTDIQSADRFIAYDESWFRRECARDPNPLPLATAEFVRISSQKLRFQANPLQETRCFVLSLRGIEGGEVHSQRFSDDA